MYAVVSKHRQEIEKIEVRDRFDFEDRCLSHLVPPRPCRDYQEHHPGPKGVRVVLLPETGDFEARAYLEFKKHLQDETHYQVMQEGQPTAYTVVMG
ncbi:hypothetical protein GETHLI_18880 [Geothrix limicola]|uniref:Uncharacterized protein n=1 Tax=Geothrix limicola TaxID=2927978 RepID=A0ABQ5QG23_9BACT|nr:hypothetical protein [Geothrix limicola]GLH73386.1 hypothetical protein GETHLI_18880 [Geothrix limicola]